MENKLKVCESKRNRRKACLNLNEDTLPKGDTAWPLNGLGSN